MMTVPRFIDEDCDTPSKYNRRMVIVANALPLLADRDTKTGSWNFSLDQDSLLLQMKDGIIAETEVIYVGSLQVDIDVAKQEEIAQQLLEDFNCVPTFRPAELPKDFYHELCKQQLWPLFHYMLPICPDRGDTFESSLWQAYVSTNKIFADKVTEVMGPNNDFVWIHDYHLMILPTFLRKRFNRVKLGFFLHSPFPSSEIYKSLPVRNEILRALLNCNLVGFHTFDFAQHFLSCCSRMSGLEYECKQGYIGLNNFGRPIYIKILPVGVQLWHEKHYRYVSSHDVAYWAYSLLQDLVRASKNHYSKRCWGLGFAQGFKILALSPNFRKLSVEHIISAYEKNNIRAIFLEYDGTVVPQASIIKTPSIEVLQILNDLCSDTTNSVFIVSGRGRDSLSEWFEQCEQIGLAAEHGHFIRWNKTHDWESGQLLTDFYWKNITDPMRLYTKTTDGSYIETKDSAMVWHHQDANSDFGRRQALELLDHLENVLANEPVIVKKGQYIVEVKPQGISKGLTGQNIMSTMAKNGKAAEFVLCMDDDA